MGAVLSHNGKYLFISNGRDKSIAVINVSSRRVLRTINDVGARPWGIGVSADDKHIYTANGPSNDVSVLEVDTGTIKTRIKVDGGAWGLVVADP
jgi:YVTN family beta-propeller protein